MASGPVRQRYSLGTGGALQQVDNRNVTPIKYARGGAVKGTINIKNDYKGRAPGDKQDVRKFARGGGVTAVRGTGRLPGTSAYMQPTNMNGKAVGPRDKISPPGARFKPANSGSGPQAVVTTAARNMGNVPTTTLTQKPVPGFKKHIAKKI